MLKARIKRQTNQVGRIAQRLTAIEASIIALDDEDLLDIADIFKQKPETPIAQCAFAEMDRRKISL